MREIRKEGRSIARVNGRSVNVSLLKELGALLVDIHGQAEHLSLLDPRAHLGLLDRYAEVARPLSDYRQTYHALPVILFQLLLTGNLFGVLFQVIYLVIAVPVVYSRLSGIQLFR